MKIRFALTMAAVAALSGLASGVRAQWSMPPVYNPAAAGMTPAGAPMGPMAPMGPIAPAAAPMVMMPAPAFMPPGAFPVQQASAWGGETQAADQGGHCSKCNNDCCPGGGNCYDFAVFADFLYLRARDSEVAYAVEVNSAVAPPTPAVQVGPVGVADMDYQPAWRGGFTTVLDECSSLTLQYTMFEANTYSRIDSTPSITEIQGLLFHPTTTQASIGGVYAEAFYDMDFDLVDLDYREMISYDCFHQTNFLVGARYGRLQQQLRSSVVDLGASSVATDIDFDGVGFRMGLETTRYSRRGLLAYFRGYSSVLVGDFNATYDQTDTFGGSVVSTEWQAGRMVPIVDLEMGFGWTSSNGYWRFSAGYVYSAWFNVVKTDEWINHVQANDFVGLSDAITFDGLVGRIETRF